MPTAILIIFEYKIKQLPGAIIDLYHSYKWCESFGCNINVFTDIQKINNMSILEDAIDNKIVNEDIINFYEFLISKNIVTNPSELLFKIKNKLMEIDDNKLIIYYSGHGTEDNAVMPNGELLSFISFRENILESLDSYAEIFWILDCCNPNGLNLPFKLKNNSFELSSSKIQCVTQPILLLISSQSNEKSIATKYGSIFSRLLFNFLSKIKKNRNLKHLIDNLSKEINILNTGYKQTISLYSSYIIHPILWLWIGTNKEYDIVSDISLSTLIVRRKQY